MEHVLNDNISVQSPMWLFSSRCPFIGGTNIFCLICFVKLFGKARGSVRLMYGCSYVMRRLRYEKTLTLWNSYHM
jgi:hypothetical protein